MNNVIRDEDYSVKNSDENKKKTIRQFEKTKEGYKWGCTIFLLVCSIVNLILGLVSLHYDYLEIVMTERIRMRPGFPPAEKWKDPPIRVRAKIHLFTISNPDEFLNGTDKKLKLKEIGPIVYAKKIKQEDVVYHDDSTLSYTTVREIEYLEDENEPGILNTSIIIPNPMLLGMSSYINDDFFMKFGFNVLSSKDNVFVNRTVYEVLWNFTSPVLEVFKKIPLILPRRNAGILYNAFYPEMERYNVKIGPEHGFENFFKINTLNGNTKISVYEDDNRDYCPFSLVNASDGTGFPPYLTKDTTIIATTHKLCRTFPMVFEKEMQKGNIKGYKFVLRDDIYKRVNDSNKDCLKRSGAFLLPDGLIDASKCAFGMPVALSNPHFYGFSGEWENYLEGIQPNEKEHSSHILVEPKTGVQLEAVVRIQSNLPIPKLKGFTPDIERFNNMIVPCFWLEYSMTDMDPTIQFYIEFLVNVLPILQPIIVVILLTLSIVCILKAVFKCTTLKSKSYDWTRKTKLIYPKITEIEKLLV